MSFNWEQAFCDATGPSGFAARARDVKNGDLLALKDFLDLVHAKHALLEPYFTTKNYPVVENRELLPSFEVDLYEYKELPGFSMVVLPRRLAYFQEIFQYDILHSPESVPEAERKANPALAERIRQTNLNALTLRIPKQDQDRFRQRHQGADITSLENYPELLPTLLHMERAHVLALDSADRFTLAGVYSSFPSYLDTELKQFGLRIGKFKAGDDALYERNRLFVYQFLMELYGFPIVSERRTSAAMFARRLHRSGESFLVRVLGQSDRTITTLYSHPDAKHYPRVEKLALVSVHEHFKDTVKLLREGGYFVDEERRVVVLRVVYNQHKYDPDNVRQDRALSVVRQEVLHPVTGVALSGLNIIKDSYSMFLRLNDIVRGEYHGRVVYKRHEIVEGTETDEKRLKFLHCWLTKHQRRIISYSDDFYANVVKVLDGYLLSPDNYERFTPMRGLHQEVWSKYSYIQQARKVKTLEDLLGRRLRGQKLSYLAMLSQFTEIVSDLKFEMANYFHELVERVLKMGDTLLQDRYIQKNFVGRKDEELSPYGQQIKKMYARLVSLLDEFERIRKLRTEPPRAQQAVTL
ncbi:hypothetical protein NNJEOMEG_02182 [Fundidesulfovibrio magnetotacticus]|uniref:Uncharacterized protein n=1 Tax=Fundidesulfovibrio magnetotacticus TaxID=2730080 RepID=A0A6V8LVK9_9BACT|nr:hypothetical protein [Fundidesulfovibrio magnetotacticus]GFK94338.1 hypothetical protein NNJEOMEG_02182 [Fundidesulfovibrio magnetotacticus]